MKSMTTLSENLMSIVASVGVGGKIVTPVIDPAVKVEDDEEPESAKAKKDEGPEGKEPDREKIIDFFMKNPEADDMKFHALTDKEGWNTHEAEEVVYEMIGKYVRFLRGGKSVKANFDPKTLPEDVLKLGMEVEAEHSDDPDTQMRIVADHAVEYMTDGKVDPEKVRAYYVGIKALEAAIKGRAA